MLNSKSCAYKLLFLIQVYFQLFYILDSYDIICLSVV